MTGPKALLIFWLWQGRQEERLASQLSTNPCIVHRSDFKTTGIQFFNLLLQVVRVFERIVPKVNIILKSKRELALGKETTRGMVTVEPIEERFERVQPLVKGEHDLWGSGRFIHQTTNRQDAKMGMTGTISRVVNGYCRGERTIGGKLPLCLARGV